MNQKSRKRAISYISGILRSIIYFSWTWKLLSLLPLLYFLETVKEFFLLRQRRDASAHALDLCDIKTADDNLCLGAER